VFCFLFNKAKFRSNMRILQEILTLLGENENIQAVRIYAVKEYSYFLSKKVVMPLFIVIIFCLILGCE
jgi:hypothetical protein